MILSSTAIKKIKEQYNEGYDLNQLSNWYKVPMVVIADAINYKVKKGNRKNFINEMKTYDD